MYQNQSRVEQHDSNAAITLFVAEIVYLVRVTCSNVSENMRYNAYR